MKIKETHEIDDLGTNTWTFTDDTGQRVSVVVDENMATITTWRRSPRGRYVMEDSVAVDHAFGPLVERALRGFGS